MVILSYLVPVAVTCLGVWLLFLRGRASYDYYCPTGLAVSQIADGDTDHRALFLGRWRHYYDRTSSLPRQAGFVEIGIPDSGEILDANEVGKRLEKLDFKIQGVAVDSFLQYLAEIARPARWNLRGRVTKQVALVALDVALCRGATPEKTWHFEARGDAEKDAAGLLERAIDEAVFRIPHDLASDPKWSHLFPDAAKFDTATGMSSYYRAMRSLVEYFTDRRPDELETALAALREFHAALPEYDTGPLLLGMALTESRRESEAISVLTQALARPQPSQRAEFRLRLLLATARTKLYLAESTATACSDLAALITAIEQARQDPANATERIPLTELLAHAYTQRAHCFALFLAYLRYEDMATALGPGSPSPLDDAQRTALADEATRRAVVEQKVRDIYDEHRNLLQRAENAIGELQPHWSAVAFGDQRQADLDHKYAVTSGYGHYRFAGWSSVPADLAELFRKAREQFWRADELRPKNYLVLQYLGLLHRNPRYDPSGSLLDVAIDYLERAIELKKSDYFGYEVLATALLRKVRSRGVSSRTAGLIEKGLEQAAAAVRLRPRSWSARLAEAEFLLMKLEFTNGADPRAELERALRESLGLAEVHGVGGTVAAKREHTWIRLARAARTFGEFADDPSITDKSAAEKEAWRVSEFARRKAELVAKLDDLVASYDEVVRDWVAREVVDQAISAQRRARSLRDQVAAATRDNWRDIVLVFG